MQDFEGMSYQERYESLNKNVVFVARHFQYQIEVFFQSYSSI